MFLTDTDRDWENFGTRDPYFSVVTHKEYHKDNLTNENRLAFFESGCDYIDGILHKIKKHIDSEFTPKKTLDFGCGVGRLLIPLASISENVVGVDVSQSMLNEAKANCGCLANVSFIKSDDNLSSLGGKYDFIHSL